MESALRSLTRTPSFPQPQPAHQPPLLLLPSPQYAISPATRPAPRAQQPLCRAAPSPKMASPGPSVPITVAAPCRKRVAPATEGEVDRTETGSLYSMSPPPSCVPMPTSLLATVAAARKAPTACAVEVSGAGAGVDVGATDELRRLLRL